MKRRSSLGYVGSHSLGSSHHHPRYRRHKSHIGEAAENAGAAAMKAATTKYTCLTTTHHFIPRAIGKGGSNNIECAGVVADIGNRTSQVTIEFPRHQNRHPKTCQYPCREEMKSGLETLSKPTRRRQ